MKLVEADIHVSNMTLDTFSTGGFDFESSNATIFDSSFLNGINYMEDSAIKCQECSILQIENCIFSDNFSFDTGGGLKVSKFIGAPINNSYTVKN